MKTPLLAVLCLLNITANACDVCGINETPPTATPGPAGIDDSTPAPKSTSFHRIWGGGDTSVPSPAPANPAPLASKQIDPALEAAKLNTLLLAEELKQVKHLVAISNVIAASSKKISKTVPSAVNAAVATATTTPVSTVTDQWTGYVPTGVLNPPQPPLVVYHDPYKSELDQAKFETALMRERAKQVRLERQMLWDRYGYGYRGYGHSRSYGSSYRSSTYTSARIGFGVQIGGGCRLHHKHTSRCR